MKQQKQLPRGVPRKKCSENVQQIYRRTPMPKCDFNIVALQLYWNHTSAWVLPVNLLHIFRKPFLKYTSGFRNRKTTGFLISIQISNGQGPSCVWLKSNKQQHHYKRQNICTIAFKIFVIVANKPTFLECFNDTNDTFNGTKKKKKEW